ESAARRQGYERGPRSYSHERQPPLVGEAPHLVDHRRLLPDPDRGWNLSGPLVRRVPAPAIRQTSADYPVAIRLVGADSESVVADSESATQPLDPLLPAHRPDLGEDRIRFGQPLRGLRLRARIQGQFRQGEQHLPLTDPAARPPHGRQRLVE